MANTVFRKLPDLRVIDLKSELEKRELDRSGNKAALLSRLQEALLAEGQDPEVYMFEVEEVPGSKKKKLRRDKESDSQEAECDEDDEEEVESDLSVRLDSCKGSMDSDGTVDSGDATVVKVPNPEAVEPKCPFTVEDTISLHKANQNHGGEPSLIVNADENSAESQPVEEFASLVDGNRTLINTDQEETVNGDLSQAEKLPIENKPSTVGEESAEESTEKLAKAELQSDDVKSSSTQQVQPESGVPEEKPSVTSTGVSLWVSGLASTTRATDLKALFSKFGRVSTAKIVTSAKAPGSKCYGFVTMSNPDEASKCIQHLHRTELHGRMISVERAKSDQLVATKKAGTASVLLLRKAVTVSSNSALPKSEALPKLEEKIDVEASKAVDQKIDKKTITETGHTTASEPRRDKDISSRPHERTERSRERYSSRHHHLSRSHSRRPPRIFMRRPYRRGAPSYRSSRYMMPRSRPYDMRRDRESEIMLEKMRQREKEHKQREEMLRIEREKARLRAERERLEREKLELQQQQMRIAYERRDNYRERRSSERYERDSRLDRGFTTRRETERRDQGYRMREMSRPTVREDRRMLSPRRGRDMPSPRGGSSWGTSGNSNRHMGGSRDRPDYNVRGSYQSGHGSGPWSGQPDLPAPSGGGGWARPVNSGVWTPNSVFTGVNPSSSASYSGGGDRFDAYKYSGSVSRRY